MKEVKDKMRLFFYLLILIEVSIPTFATILVDDCGACNNCIKGNTQQIFDGSHESSILEKVYVKIISTNYRVGLVFSPKIWALRGTGNFGEKIFPGDSPKFPVYIIA